VWWSWIDKGTPVILVRIQVPSQPLALLQPARRAARVVCAGIHMSDIPSFPYRLLWEERRLVSVANLYQVNPAAAPRRDHR
jgi:D-arabinose 1-dehydrogenase-like Zn-dependent alcohol dehydrogenase